MMIINMLKIPIMDSPKEDMIIFMSGFLEMILKGLKVLNSFKIDKLTSRTISIIAVQTMKKSNFDHELLRYAFSPIKRPCAIILRRDSKIKIKLNAKSRISAILSNYEPG